MSADSPSLPQCQKTEPNPGTTRPAEKENKSKALYDDDDEVATSDTLVEIPYTDEEYAQLKEKIKFQDSVRMMGYWKADIEKKSPQHWNKFYSSNQNKFFKNRYYLVQLLPELEEACREAERGVREPPTLLEVGCGVGNAVIPMLARYASLRVNGMDCSKSAIAFLNENIMTELTKTISQLRDVPPSPSNAPENPEVETKLRTEVSDAGAKEPSNLASLSAVAPSSSSLPSESNNEPTVTTTNPSLTRPVSPDDPRLTKRWDFQVCNLEKPEWPFHQRSADFATLIFVLSAINPPSMPTVFKLIADRLKPGGMLYLRDYGEYDEAMLRFAAGSKITERLYVRGDGTRAYFFKRDELMDLAKGAGFESIQIQFRKKTIFNRKLQYEMKRNWVELRAYMPHESPISLSAANSTSSGPNVAAKSTKDDSNTTNTST